MHQDNRITNETEDPVEKEPDSSATEISLEAIWEYDFNEQTNEFEMKQLRSINEQDLTGETLEKIVNQSWPRVQIEYNRASNDTVFITIPDSEVLTQQMGSAGAKGFMITTTFSFTELANINYVSFDFVEGDHAMPGVYNRNSWDEKPL
jgi:AICAR transformylase/IMP cyclohydrolase PurH